MGWKVFFWVYLVLAILSLLDFSSSPGFIDMLGYPMSVVELLALFSYSYKKKLLNVRQWKILLWAYGAFFGMFFLGQIAPNVFTIFVSARLESVAGMQKTLAIALTYSLFVLFIYILKSLVSKSSKKSK